MTGSSRSFKAMDRVKLYAQELEPTILRVDLHCYDPIHDRDPRDSLLLDRQLPGSYRFRS